MVAGPATGPGDRAARAAHDRGRRAPAPGRRRRVLGPPASALVGPRHAASRHLGPDPLSAPIAEQGSIEARLAAAEAALAARLADAGPPDRSIAAATRWLARHPAGRIEDLARLLEIGPRQLHRRFVAAVGYGPKTLQRVLRLQRVLALAAPEPAREPRRPRRGGGLCRPGAHEPRAAGAHRPAARASCCRARRARSPCPICSRPRRRPSSRKASSNPARRRSWSSGSAW